MKTTQHEFSNRIEANLSLWGYKAIFKNLQEELNAIDGAGNVYLIEETGKGSELKISFLNAFCDDQMLFPSIVELFDFLMAFEIKKVGA